MFCVCWAYQVDPMLFQCLASVGHYRLSRRNSRFSYFFFQKNQECFFPSYSLPHQSSYSRTRYDYIVGFWLVEIAICRPSFLHYFLIFYFSIAFLSSFIAWPPSFCLWYCVLLITFYLFIHSSFSFFHLLIIIIKNIIFLVSLLSRYSLKLQKEIWTTLTYIMGLFDGRIHKLQKKY